MRYFPYPKEVYNINEDITRANMRAYDLEQKRIEDECIRLAPNYHALPCRERLNIRRQAEKNLS